MMSSIHGRRVAIRQWPSEAKLSSSFNHPLSTTLIHSSEHPDIIHDASYTNSHDAADAAAPASRTGMSFNYGLSRSRLIDSTEGGTCW